MRFNKIALFFSISTIWVVVVKGELINAPNTRLGFPSRTQSVANALYSAIELPLTVFPHEQMKEEVKTMKEKILDQSKEQFKALHPDARFGHVKRKKQFRWHNFPE
ncbi:hypothetical protein GCK72_017944 [Caenorhabditis remanei]|uniref:Uncharacterized protein n=1 Tax=Caenorhabditis remanei TaxID=31234 RepID=A0A6A5G8T6_CAERE|nr:hypothetical protein GCK72_017944 [Caenorhabditis remanei]KAF1751390.1 hypothetical protein GCK72_017944 [Caenorhabditis remanei]